MPFTITLLHAHEVKALTTEQTSPGKPIRGKCQRCGNCCAHHDCPAFDPLDRICRVYYNRPTACRTYPGRQDVLDRVKCPGFSTSKSKTCTNPPKNSNKIVRPSSKQGAFIHYFFGKTL